jgi:ABC-type bacteriocin/lantibiotic exporter with double-glycine peptidase domain
MGADLFLSFFKNHQVLTFLSCLSVIAFPIQEVILPDFYGKWIESLRQPASLRRYTFIIALLWILSYSIFLMYDWVQLKISSKLESWMRAKTFERILRSQETHTTPINRTELISQMTKYPNFYVEIYVNLQEVILPSAVFLLFLAGYLFSIRPVLCYVFLGGMVILYLISRYMLPRLLHLSCDRDKQHNSIMGFLDDIINNLSSVLSNAQTATEVDSLGSKEAAFRKVYEKGSMLLLYYRNLVLMIVLLMIFGILYLSYRMFLEKKLSTGKIVALFVIFTCWISDIKRLYEHIFYWIYTQGNVEVTNTSISAYTLGGHGGHGGHGAHGGHGRASSSEERGQKEQKGQKGVELVLENVTFIAPSTGALILDSVNLRLEPGNTLVIHGEIGSGKTTLLKLILGLETSTSGTIRIGDLHLSRENLVQWRSQIFYVPQDTVLFERTIYENLSYGSDVSREECMALLHKHNMFNFLLQGNKKNLDRSVGKDGKSLSGGQRRMVMFFRCLASPKKIVLCDEPTSNLDEQTSKLVYTILDSLSQHKSILIVSHDPQLISRFRSTSVKQLSNHQS